MDSDDGFTSPFNMGENPGEFSIMKWLNRFWDVPVPSPKSDFNLLQDDDPNQRKPDIALAQNKLSWFPKLGSSRN